MSSSLDHNTKQRIAKALKQLPYKQSEKDFINTAIDKHLEELYKSRDLRSKSLVILKTHRDPNLQRFHDASHLKTHFQLQLFLKNFQLV